MVGEGAAAQVCAEHHEFARVGPAERPNIHRRLLSRCERGDIERDGVVERTGQHGDPELRRACRARGNRDGAHVEEIAEVRTSPAGTRPEPAESVPIAISASPVVTATAEPELEPPLMYSGRRLSGTAPYGDRVPTSPVANWSRLVLPTSTAPAARNAATAGASRPGR